MTAFVVTAAIMVAIGLVWLLPTLLRGGARTRIDRTAVNLGILKDQLAELEGERRRGTIDEAQYTATRSELQQRVLEDTQAEPSAETLRPSRLGRSTAIAVVLVVPLAAALIYLKYGEPAAFNPLVRDGPEAAHQFGKDELNVMTQRLAERLKAEPDNANGWVTLARTYYSMGRFGDAAAAFEKLVKLVPDDASIWADYADALAMAHGRRIAGRPMELINRALELEPTQWKALAMAGTEAFDRQDYKRAAELWEKLRDSLPADVPLKQQIVGSINEARSRGGMALLADAAPSAKPAAVPKPAATPPAKAAAPEKKAATDAKAAGEKAAPAGGARVAGTIALSDQLRGKVAPSDTVVIFARAAEGSRMPLALLRVQAKDLPKRFALDDSMAVAPEFKLSNFPEVVVGARVSKTGSPMPQKGDFEGVSTPVKLGRSDIAVTIDTELR